MSDSLNDILQQFEKVKKLQDASLALTGMIVSQTYKDLQAGKISTLDASRIISLLGLRVDNILPTSTSENEDDDDNNPFIKL